MATKLNKTQKKLFDGAYRFANTYRIYICRWTSRHGSQGVRQAKAADRLVERGLIELVSHESSYGAPPCGFVHISMNEYVYRLTDAGIQVLEEMCA